MAWPWTLHQLGMSSKDPKSEDVTLRSSPGDSFATAFCVFITGRGQSNPLVLRVSKFLNMPSV